MSPTFAASTQNLADAQPAEGASVSGTPSVRLSYEFADGWKFVRVAPKDAAARKIEGGPRAGAPCVPAGHVLNARSATLPTI